MTESLGRYRLLEVLGKGGMATVYRAHDPQLGRDVAIKVMHPFIAEKSEAAKRFEREARAVAGLHHPNVLQLHDYQPQDGERPAYLVMELLTGPSLRSFLDQNGTPFAEVGAIIGLRVAQALEAAHARDVVHRDVKPENVMFDRHRVVLCDFGIARLQVEGHTMTATGAVIGSPTFMSPEQARGEATDARSDIFSLGSLLYVLATGVPPFVATQPLVVMSKIAKGEHPPPTAKNPRVPRWLERAIEKCLQLEPQDRYATASEVQGALADGLTADGLGDFDRELETYLKDPPGYNEKFPARMVAAALGQMRSAAKDKRRALALSAASRALAWEPQHAEALAITEKFEERPRWILPAAGAVVLSLAIASGGWAVYRVGQRPLPPPKPVEIVEKPMVEKPIAEKRVEEKPSEQKPIEEKHKKIKLAAKPIAPEPEVKIPEPEKIPEPPPPPPLPGKLTVAISPWCDLSVDGRARGRAPLTLELPAGAHQLECVHSTGARVKKEIVLEAGKTEIWREQLFADAKITARPGLEFAVDEGAPSGGPRQATPGRHRITLFREGKADQAKWLTVPPEGCRLVDTPELTCEKP